MNINLTNDIKNKIEIFPLEENVNAILRIKPSIHNSEPFIKNNSHYDTIYNENELNRKIYDNTVLPIIKTFMKGIDVNFLAFGPKNGGKTFTFIGEKSNIDAFKKDSKGIILYAITSIFKALNFMNEKKIKYQIGYSLVEIPSNSNNVKISMNENFKNLNNLKDVKQSILKHYKEKKYEDSHNVFSVILIQYRINKKSNLLMKLESKLNFIDFSHTVTDSLLDKIDINPFIEPKKNLHSILSYCPYLDEMISKSLNGKDRTLIFHCTPILNESREEIEIMSKMENIVQLLRQIKCIVDINCTESSNSDMAKESSNPFLQEDISEKEESDEERESSREEYVIKERNNKKTNYHNSVNYLEPITEEDSQEILMAMKDMENELAIAESLLNNEKKSKIQYSEPTIKKEIITSEPNISKKIIAKTNDDTSEATGSLKKSSIQNINNDSSLPNSSSNTKNSDQKDQNKTQTTYLLPSLIPCRISTKSPKVISSVPVSYSSTINTNTNTNTTTNTTEKEKNTMTFIESLKDKFMNYRNNEKKEDENKTLNNSTISKTNNSNIKTIVSKPNNIISQSSNSNEEKVKGNLENSNNTKIKHLTKAIEAKDAEIKDRVEIIKQYTDTLLSLEENQILNRKNSQKYQNFEKELKQRTEEGEQNIDELREKLKYLSNLINEKDKQIKDIDDDAKNKKIELETSKNKLSFLISVLDEKDSIIKKSNEKVKSIEKENQTLNDSIEDREVRIKCLKEQLNEKEKINQILQSQMGDLSERINQAQERMENLYQLQIKQKEKHKIQLEKQSLKYKKIIKKLIEKKRLSTSSSIPLSEISLSFNKDAPSDLNSIKSEHNDFTNDDDVIATNLVANQQGNKIYAEVLNHYNKIFKKLKEVLVDPTDDNKNPVNSPVLSNPDAEISFRKTDELIKSEHQHIKNEENYQMDLIQAAETLNSQVNHWKQYSSDQQRHIEDLQAEQARLMEKIESLSKLQHLKEGDNEENERLIKEANTTLESIKIDIMNSIIVDDIPYEDEKEFSLSDYKEELGIDQIVPSLDSPEETKSESKKSSKIDSNTLATTATINSDITKKVEESPMQNVSIISQNIVSPKYNLPNHEEKEYDNNKNKQENNYKMNQQNQKINDLRKCCDRQSERIVNLEFSLMKAQALIASLTQNDENAAAKFKALTNFEYSSTPNSNYNEKPSTNTSINNNIHYNLEVNPDIYNLLNNREFKHNIAFNNENEIENKNESNSIPIQDNIVSNTTTAISKIKPSENNVIKHSVSMTSEIRNTNSKKSRDSQRTSYIPYRNSIYRQPMSSPSSIYPMNIETITSYTTDIHPSSSVSSNKLHYNNNYHNYIDRKNSNKSKKKNSLKSIFSRNSYESIKYENEKNNSKIKNSKFSSISKFFSKKNNNNNNNINININSSNSFKSSICKNPEIYQERNHITSSPTIKRIYDYELPLQQIRQNNSQSSRTSSTAFTSETTLNASPCITPQSFMAKKNISSNGIQYSNVYKNNEATKYYNVITPNDTNINLPRYSEDYTKKHSPEVIQPVNPTFRSTNIAQASKLGKENQTELEKIHPKTHNFMTLDDHSLKEKKSEKFDNIDNIPEGQVIDERKEIIYNDLSSSKYDHSVPENLKEDIPICSEIENNSSIEQQRSQNIISNDTFYSSTFNNESTNNYTMVNETELIKTPKFKEKKSEKSEGNINSTNKIKLNEYVNTDITINETFSSPTLINNEITAYPLVSTYYDKNLLNDKTATITEFSEPNVNRLIKKQIITSTTTYIPEISNKTINPSITKKAITSYDVNDTALPEIKNVVHTTTISDINNIIEDISISSSFASTKQNDDSDDIYHSISIDDSKDTDDADNSTSVEDSKDTDDTDNSTSVEDSKNTDDTDNSTSVADSKDTNESDYSTSIDDSKDTNDINHSISIDDNKEDIDDIDHYISIDDSEDIDDDLENIANTTMKSIEKYEFVKRSNIKRNQKLFHSKGNCEEIQKEMDKLNELNQNLQELKEKKKINDLEALNSNSNKVRKIDQYECKYGTTATTIAKTEKNENKKSKKSKNKKIFNLFGKCKSNKYDDDDFNFATTKTSKNRKNGSKDGCNTITETNVTKNNYKKANKVDKYDDHEYYNIYTRERINGKTKSKKGGFFSKCTPNYFDLEM